MTRTNGIGAIAILMLSSLLGTAQADQGQKYTCDFSCGERTLTVDSFAHVASEVMQGCNLPRPYFMVEQRDGANPAAAVGLGINGVWVVAETIPLNSFEVRDLHYAQDNVRIDCSLRQPDPLPVAGAYMCELGCGRNSVSVTPRSFISTTTLPGCLTNASFFLDEQNGSVAIGLRDDGPTNLGWYFTKTIGSGEARPHFYQVVQDITIECNYQTRDSARTDQNWHLHQQFTEPRRPVR
ncbi:MAG: hypothetical protein HY074_09925 [Deltaproteobacteria bacterium]|nr:hypothetical protein [Deltaproteobacteria bacterium]